MKRQCNKLGFDYEETKENLMYVVDFFQLGKSINTRHIDKETLPKINDPDDQMLVEAAYASDADYLITSDKKSGILNLEDTPFECYTPGEYLAIDDSTSH
ncbi:PIN domain-containing protein [Oceanobacillus alkalisoli]|uniref:PIN domain-containing protein n=1 Tax=Oceanobacillus alkalisoli TaxID=2925113 RepID=UPI001EE4BDF0|nr:PIN domain-containing protein [Oceanobacillus alkalisoli]MCG5102261.1 PIN domain-containing protein [Oceanobacillus alkalisoli]